MSDTNEAPATTPRCNYIESEHLAAGWGCCQCRSYNGLWRLTCKHCQHDRCEPLAPDAVLIQEAAKKGEKDGKK